MKYRKKRQLMRYRKKPTVRSVTPEAEDAPPTPVVTEQMVERAAAAMWRDDCLTTTYPWEDEEPGVQQWYRHMARAALLAAALSPEEGNEPNR